MKYFLSLVVCVLASAGYLVFGAALTGFFVADRAQAGDPQAPSPAGRYLDVRTATVFGGACHIGSEDGSQGRSALFAVEFLEGKYADENLVGVRAVGIVESKANLGRELDPSKGGDPSERRSLLVVDAPTDAGADAAVAWLRSVAGTELGQVVETRRASVVMHLDAESGGAFELTIPGLLKASGAGLPDRECCSMPEQVWYGPLLGKALVPAAVVGFTERAQFDGTMDLGPWRYDGANTAFLGTFASGSTPAPSDCCGSTSPLPESAQSW